MPGASTITLTVDGSTIKAADGSLLDAAGDRHGRAACCTRRSRRSARGRARHDALRASSPTPARTCKPGTTDDVKPGPDGVLMTGDDIYLLPIAGVTVYILGHEDQAVITGADGSFSFSSVPTGDVKLVIDGTTATNAPSGVLLPRDGLGPDHPAGPGQHRDGQHGHAPGAGGQGTAQGVYLPRLQTSILKPAGSNTPTTISLDPDAAAGPDARSSSRSTRSRSCRTAWSGMDGQKMASGQVGISTVPPHLMDMLPPGVMQLPPRSPSRRRASRRSRRRSR